MEGSSMNPMLLEGNTICFKEYDGERLRQGNIVYYINSEGKDAIHRIVAGQRDERIIKGDNNKNEEERDYRQVKGILAMVLYT